MLLPNPDPSAAFFHLTRELRFLVDSAEDPNCRGVLVLGAAGVGKTTLLNIFADRLLSQGREGGFASLSRYPDPEELFLHLNRLLDQQHTPSQTQYHDGTPNRRRSHVGSLVEEWIRRIFDREYHLFLDGFDEFVDQSRLSQTLSFVIDSTPPTVKFYLSSRTEYNARFIHHPGIRTLSLAPPTQSELTAYFQERFRDQPIVQSNQTRLATLTQRNPILISLVSNFIEDFILRSERSGKRPCDSGDSLQLSINDILREIIDRTLSNLEPHDRVHVEEALFILSGFDLPSIQLGFIEALLGKPTVNLLILHASPLLMQHQGVSGIGFVHPLVKEYCRNALLQGFRLDPHRLDFGAEAAERDNKLQEVLVSPPILIEIAGGKKSIVLGDRGSGKSALVTSLQGARDGLADLTADEEENAAILIPSPELSVFIKKYEERYAHTAISAEAFKEVWLLYFAENLARHSWGFATSPSKQALRPFLLRQSPHFLQAAAASPTGRMVVWIAEHFQTKVDLSLYGIPLTFEASGRGLGRRTLDLNQLIESVAHILEGAGVRVKLVLDRLDEVYKYDRDLQEKMMQGFFLAEEFMAKLDRVRIVTLLRTDLYELYDIQEKNKHVGRSARLRWSILALYGMLLARVGSNDDLGPLAAVLRGGQHGDPATTMAKLRLIFPDQIEGRPLTEYLEFSLRNARGQIAPRQIVLLLLALRDAMVQEPKRGPLLPLFEEHHLTAALDLVSKLSFDEVLDDFRIGRTFLQNCRAGNINEMSLETVRRLADAKEGDVNEQLTRLEKLGVLGRILTLEKVGPTFRLPPLYTRCWSAPVA